MKNSQNSNQKIINRVQFKIKLIEVIFQFVVLSGIALCGIVNRKYFEVVFLLASFFTLRYAFPKTYHCKTVVWCAFWSIAIFWIALPYTLPISISLFSSVIVGVLITYVLYLIQCKEELIEIQKKNIWNMTEDELIQHCHDCGIRKDCYVKFVVMAVNQIPYREIARKLFVAETTLYDWSEICRKKLNISKFKLER